MTFVLKNTFISLLKKSDKLRIKLHKAMVLK